MRQIVMNKWAWMLAVVMVCASCMEKVESRLDNSEEEDNSGSTAEQLKPASAYFDFDLTKTVTLSLDYGTWGGGSLFGIYTENPLAEEAVESDTRSFRSDVQTVATVFADKEGRYTGTIEVPSYVETLYVVTDSPWLTDMIEAKIENGRASVKSGNNEWTASRAATRTTDNLEVVPITTGNYKNLYSIVGDTWNEWGKAGDPDGVMSTGSMTPDKLQQIYRKLLWKEDDANFTVADFAEWVSTHSSYANNVCDNSSMVETTEHVNCSIAETYTDENGKVQTVDKATVYLTFVNEAAAYMSTLGYYYYKTDQCPSDKDDVKKYMVFPNASIASGFPFSTGNWRYAYKPLGAENAPISINTRVQLLYVDDAGNVMPDFPPGYTIGFFLIANSDGAKDANETHPGANELKSGRTIHYSNNEWNKNEVSHYLAMTTADGEIVFCIEDANDNKNFCDMLFCVDCDPRPAMHDAQRPKVEPVTPIYYVDNKTTNNYAFEDQWPTGGDYDLNDVIIRHDRVVSKTLDNYVAKVVDNFTAIQPAGSAQYRNAFAVRGSKDVFNAVTSMTNGVLKESETNSYIITGNTNSARGTTISLVREFTTLLSDDDAALGDWEPYLIAQYDPNEADRIEIHLPKQSVTSKMREGLAGTEDDAYYIDKSNMYPFSIRIPSDFEPAPEQMRIDVAYPQYVDWVKSNGTSNTDWYKYPSFE